MGLIFTTGFLYIYRKQCLAEKTYRVYVSLDGFKLMFVNMNRRKDWFKGIKQFFNMKKAIQRDRVWVQ